VNDPTLALPFDQYQRYRLVTDILQHVRAGQTPMSVLDVGGRTALLRKFLPDDQVFIVDVEESEEEGLVLGTGSCLPFQTDSVDAVVTFDTLEHVPPAYRADFLAECQRVARRWVVMAGPYDTPGVAHGEELLTQFLKDKLGIEHRYLAEHAAHGLPKLDETERALSAGGARVVSIGHANLHRWLALMSAELYLDHTAPLRALAAKYYEFYNSAMYASDHALPVYRHAVVCALGDARLPVAEELLGPPHSPAGSFEPVSHVLSELLKFDVQRDVITKEWERLETVNADLHLDLDGHKDSLLVLNETNEVQSEMIEELRGRTVELLSNEEELLDSVKEQQDEIKRQEAEVVRERTEGAKLAQVLRTDLEAHQQLAARLQESEAGLTVRVNELESRLDQANITLGEKQVALDIVRRELTAHRQVIDAMGSQLRDRWGNLLRALGLK
jgi:hypothetical protein